MPSISILKNWPRPVRFLKKKVRVRSVNLFRNSLSFITTLHKACVSSILLYNSISVRRCT